MNYVPSFAKAKEWEISQRRVAILCKKGRITGAELVGNRWFIPNGAQKPEDPRRVRKKRTEKRVKWGARTNPPKKIIW